VLAPRGASRRNRCRPDHWPLPHAEEDFCRMPKSTFGLGDVTDSLTTTGGERKCHASAAVSLPCFSRRYPSKFWLRIPPSPRRLKHLHPCTTSLAKRRPALRATIDRHPNNRVETPPPTASVRPTQPHHRPSYPAGPEGLGSHPVRSPATGPSMNIFPCMARRPDGVPRWVGTGTGSAWVPVTRGYVGRAPATPSIASTAIRPDTRVGHQGGWIRGRCCILAVGPRLLTADRT
jgi:hypothetical protein